MPVIDSYPVSNYSVDDVSRALGNIRYAQTFVGDGGSLCSCAFYLKKYGSPTGNITATLYATSGGAPTGSALITSIAILAEGLTTSYQTIIFNFSTPYTVDNGTTYAIAVEFNSGDGSNYLYIGSDDSSPSHSGVCYYYDSSWHSFATHDVIFYAFKNNVTIRATGTPVTGTGTTITPTIPSGTQDGDLMVAFVPCRATATPADETGWTGTALTLSSINFKLHYRIKQAGDGNPTFDITNAGAETVCAFIISFYNVHATTPLDVAITDAGDFSAPTTPFDVTLTGFNTSTDGAFAIYGWVSLDDNLWVYQSGGGVGLVSKDATDATDISICVAGESIPTAGATGDQVARQTAKAGDAGALFYFALKPVAADTAINIGTGGTFAQAGKVSENLAAAVSAQTALAPSVSESAKVTEVLGTLVQPPDIAISSLVDTAKGTEALAAAVSTPVVLSTDKTETVRTTEVVASLVVAQEEYEIESVIQSAKVTESLAAVVAAQTTLEISSEDNAALTEVLAGEIGALAAVEIQAEQAAAITEVLAGAVEAQVDLGATATQAGAVTEALAGEVGEAPAEEPLLVQVEQAAHFTEWFSPPFTETIGVSDTVIAEVLEAILGIDISTPAQAAKVTEDLAVQVASQVDLNAGVDQSAKVTENLAGAIGSQVDLNAGVAQTAKVSEDLTAAVGTAVTLAVDKSEAVKISESLAGALSTPVTLAIDKTETARVTEILGGSVAAQTPLAIDKIETVKLTEILTGAVAAQTTLEVSATDSAKLTEDLTSQVSIPVTLEASLADNARMSEARTVTVEGMAATLEILVADAVRTTESTAAEVIAQVAVELAAVDSVAVVTTDLTAAVAAAVDLNIEIAQAGAVSEDLAAIIGAEPAVTGRGRFRRIPGRTCIAGGILCVPGTTPVDMPDLDKI